MANTIKNKDRLNENIQNLESLLVLLKAARNDDITLAQISRDLNIRPQELNTALNNSFSLYFKNKLKYISEDDLSSLITRVEPASDTLLKDIFKLNTSDIIVFPKYDVDNFWNVIKNELSDKYFMVVAKHVGYNCSPMSYEAISKLLGVTRARALQIYKTSLDKLRHSSVIVKIFDNQNYIDRLEKLEQIMEANSLAYDEAYSKYTLLQEYLDKVSDVEKVISFIETHCPEVSGLAVGNAIEALNISINELNLSNRTYNALTSANCNTVTDILNTSAIDIINIKNLGKNSIIELIDAIDNLNINNNRWNELKTNLIKLM